MGPEPRPLSAELYRESLEARRTLALMSLHEGLAERAERAITPSLRAEYVARYRAMIGVEPELRQDFLSALEQVYSGGGMGVQDVIDLLRSRHQANGLGGGEGATVAGAT